MPDADGWPGTAACSQLAPSQVSAASPPAERTNMYSSTGVVAHHTAVEGTAAAADEAPRTVTFLVSVVIVPKLEVTVTDAV